MPISSTHKIVIPSYQTSFSTNLLDGYLYYNLGISNSQVGGPTPLPFTPAYSLVTDLKAEISTKKIAVISLGGDFQANQGVTTRAKSLELSFAGACIAGGEILDFKIWFVRPAVAKDRQDVMDVECFLFSTGDATLIATPPSADTLVQEAYIGRNNDAGGNISAFACTITNTVSAYGQFMENQYGSVGADVWSPGGTAVAKLIIPECFGSAMALIEVKPHASGGITIDANNPVLIYSSVEY